MSMKHPANAAQKGQVRKRRRHRAERREATREVREARNAVMRAREHPGWVDPYLRSHYP